MGNDYSQSRRYGAYDKVKFVWSRDRMVLLTGCLFEAGMTACFGSFYAISACAKPNWEMITLSRGATVRTPPRTVKSQARVPIACSFPVGRVL